MPSPYIVRTNSQFRQRFDTLQAGDVVACVLGMKPFEEALLLDLRERDIIIFPSAISQIASRSKCLQARLFSPFMVPNTKVVSSRAELVHVMDEYARLGVGRIITKKDRADCGLGINLWQDFEELFNHVSFSPVEPWPLVIQPFIQDATDIRIIWIGDIYREAYWRKSEHGFRNNLHFGGKSGTYHLNEDETRLCSKVMKRGSFPYAHIDLLKTVDGTTYLSEISLFGGTKGAKIDSTTCAKLKEEVNLAFLESLSQGTL